MTYFASYFAWSPVSSGIRTRIWQGPMVHAAPVHWLVFGSAGPAVRISFFVTVYSAAAPWYLTTSGAGMVWPLTTISTGGRTIGMPPWDAGFPIWMLASPWVEIFVTTNRSCSAEIQFISI